MSEKISCPKCAHSFSVEDVISEKHEIQDDDGYKEKRTITQTFVYDYSYSSLKEFYKKLKDIFKQEMGKNS